MKNDCRDCKFYTWRGDCRWARGPFEDGSGGDKPAPFMRQNGGQCGPAGRAFVKRTWFDWFEGPLIVMFALLYIAAIVAVIGGVLFGVGYFLGPVWAIGLLLFAVVFLIDAEAKSRHAAQMERARKRREEHDRLEGVIRRAAMNAVMEPRGGSKLD